MGAHNIEFDMAGTPSFSAIQKRFKEQQDADNRENGNGSYSGDFQTVHSVDDHTYKTFDSYSEAHNYCMEKAKKWDTVVAVRYKFIDNEKFKYSAKVEKLKTKLEALNQKLRDLNALPVKLSKFATCEGCQSKISTAHLKTGFGARTHKCPVCGEGDFRPMSIQRSEIKIKAKIELAQGLLDVQKKAEKTKGMSKFGKVGTLVAGWGAS